jgi:O-antigen/teichoic acid export membrane protein
MFESKLTPDWKIVAAALSVMALGIALLLTHVNLVILPYALLFGAGVMWTSGGILSLVWIISILRKKKRTQKERWG